MDEDGYVTLVDRKKDMIIASGFNIYPKEIDEFLMTHPKVLEVCTIGIPDAYRGETVKTYIVPRPGQTLTEEEVKIFCKEALVAYKVPKRVEFHRRSAQERRGEDPPSGTAGHRCEEKSENIVKRKQER